MNDVSRIITSIEPEPLDTDIVVVARKPEPEPMRGWDLIPWGWTVAWLIGWALVVAIAAWWMQAFAPRDIWVWVIVWVLPALVVSALLARSAAQATERTANLRRLAGAREEIVKLEEQLDSSTTRMFDATKTLTEATEMLLEQVDTSRDDLRNQILSAKDLTDSLKAQTKGLVSAQSEFTEQLKRDLVPEPMEATPGYKPLTLTLPPEAVEAEPEKLPPLNLRPAPQAEDVFESTPPTAVPDALPETTGTPSTLTVQTDSGPVEMGTVEMDVADEVTHPAGAPTALATPASGGWQWSDMLRSVDEVVPPSDRAEEVIAILRREGLSPDVLVDDGNALDAINTWESAGLPAMGQLLSIRFDEPAKVMKNVLIKTPAEYELVQLFSNERASRLDPAGRDVRMADARTEAGRAWLFIQAVLAV